MAVALQQQILERVRRTPDQAYLCQPVDRQWRQWTWAEAHDEAERLAAALRRLGLEPGDRVGLMSKNCAHWIIADIAMILAGLVSVPIYPTANARTVGQVLEHSEARACIVGKLEAPETQLAGVPDSVTSIAMPYPGARGQYRWDDLVADEAGDFEAHAAAEDDLATLLYTSGSTGEPKGAMHSYASFAFVGESLARAIGVRSGDRILSYLPLSHCTERAYVGASSFYGGSTLYFVESLDTFAEDLVHARPTLFGSVPRLWKKFQLGVLDKVGHKKLDTLLKIPLAATLVRRRVQRELGLDRCDWFASGSAPIAPVLLEWWHRLGITISEGWGMTETFAYGTQIGRGQTPRFGTISKALPGVELKTTEADELLVRCPCMMQGYYKQQQLTDESFTEGYFRTGDRAFIDEDGWVTITGRLKEVFKTDKGKYIAPVPLESELAKNELIETACIVGERLDQPVALVQLAEHVDLDMRELRSRLVDTLERVNADLEPHERLARIIVVKEPWTIDNELLTPTLKVKRDAVEKRYRDIVEHAEGKVHIHSQKDREQG